MRINPVAGLGFTYQAKPRNRVLTDNELGKLWRAIDSEDFGATEPMRILLKLALLTGQRNSEVAGARISELTLDSANPMWRIPGERMKRKNREQVVPLSPLAAELFSVPSNWRRFSEASTCSLARRTAAVPIRLGERITLGKRACRGR